VEKGVLQMRTSQFLEQKASDFSKFIVCPHGQGGRRLSQCGHFLDKGGSVFFDFVRTSFVDGPKLNYQHSFLSFIQ